MKIIVLQGRPKVGKTSTLTLMYEKLLKDGYSELNKVIATSSDDFHAILEKDGHKVGLNTAGDTVECVKTPFEAFEKAGCDIYITACHMRRTKYSPKSYIESLPGCSKIVWHNKAILNKELEKLSKKSIDK